MGITTAYLLRKRGLKVGLLEADDLCAGVTGHTTAKLTSQHGLCYAALIKKHGLEAARRYGAAQEAAKEWIASESAKLGIDCDFERCEAFIFGETPVGATLALQEAEAASECGLPAYFTTEQLRELPFTTEGACGFRDQAVFHPRKWLLGLAAAVAAPTGDGAGSYIAENVRATGLREASAAGHGSRHLVLTTRGEVRAAHVVVATHYPIFDRGLFFARLSPMRDNCVAGPVDAAAAPRNAYWSADTMMSVRSTPYEDGKRLVLVMGQKYRTGEDADTLARFHHLAAWGKANCGLDRLTHRWATHDLLTPDGLPYIGLYHAAAQNLWVTCGFKQWGMTMGTHAAHVLTALVTTGKHEDAALYSPGRVAQLTTKLLLDQLNVGKHWFVDAAKPLAKKAVPSALGGGPKTPHALHPGEALVLNVRGKNVAAFRDGNGQLRCVGATCTHLGCTVGFNNAERSWDCPCHGSRFDLGGQVLHGPATSPLPVIDVEDM